MKKRKIIFPTWYVYGFAECDSYQQFLNAFFNFVLDQTFYNVLANTAFMKMPYLLIIPVILTNVKFYF